MSQVLEVEVIPGDCEVFGYIIVRDTATRELKLQRVDNRETDYRKASKYRSPKLIPAILKRAYVKDEQYYADWALHMTGVRGNIDLMVWHNTWDEIDEMRAKL